jgi:hypothetical protein
LGKNMIKFWAWWILNILSRNMLENVRWCKHFKISSWNWTICCLMNCSKARKHVHVGGDRRLQATLRCCWKRKVLLLTHAKVLIRKGHWSTIKLIAMMKATRA